MYCFKCKKIGYVKKTHGINGEIIVELDFEIQKKFNLNNWVFVELDGATIPFLVEYYKILDNKTFIIKLKQLNSIEESKRFSLCNFLVSSEIPWILKIEQNIIGYKLFDKNNIYIGIINEYIPIQNNPIAQVIYNNQKVLVPINKKLIIKKDDFQKVIYLNILKDELINC